MANLLARFASNVYWLARYMERAENLARILDVNETFARDDQGEQSWLPVLRMNTDEERFFASNKKATAAAVVQFYVIDSSNPTSILSAVAYARENARSLRHLISTEMWAQINVFHQQVSALTRRDIGLTKLSGLCGRLKEACQAHAGITEGTLYRDEAWCFYLLGKTLERADQTSRLIDINYQHIRIAEAAPDAPSDTSRWNALLRSAAGYHAFRRTRPRGLRPHDVAVFLVADRNFPRSMAASVSSLRAALVELKRRHGLAESRHMQRLTAALREQTSAKSAKEALEGDFHLYLDSFQERLNELGDELAYSYFATSRES